MDDSNEVLQLLRAINDNQRELLKVIKSWEENSLKQQKEQNAIYQSQNTAYLRELRWSQIGRIVAGVGFAILVIIVVMRGIGLL